MEKVEIVLKFMRNIANAFLLEGLVALILGALILVYPDLLGILVGIFLVATGIGALVMAAKVYGYSKIKFEI